MAGVSSACQFSARADVAPKARGAQRVRAVRRASVLRRVCMGGSVEAAVPLENGGLVARFPAVSVPLACVDPAGSLSGRGPTLQLKGCPP